MKGPPVTPVRMRASITTLGCRLNQSETQQIQHDLEARGFEIVPFGVRADLGIINTCTVTREADAKCRQTIRRFIRTNPDAFTAVVGCYAQMGAKAIAQIPGVDLIVGNQEKLSVLDYIADGKADRPVIIRERIDREDFTISYVGDLPYPKRANLKIQDGCDYMCSFCIIPFARGRARSRDFSNLLEEARSLALQGVREVVLTGVNIGTYSNRGRGIVDVVDSLNGVDGLSRIRLSSIEPTTVPDGLIKRMADPGHALLSYLHIPLQSGSDRVLALMRRRYTAREFGAFIRRAHDTIPELCIGTDIMVGFPGETEDDFAETCGFFAANPFAYGHVFTYSERAGTQAARMSEQVSVPERNRRSARLRRLSSKRRYDFYEGQLGSTQEVLFEDRRQGQWPGYTGNYIRVVCTSNDDLTNRRARVRLERLAADYVEGSIEEMLDP